MQAKLNWKDICAVVAYFALVISIAIWVRLGLGPSCRLITCKLTLYFFCFCSSRPSKLAKMQTPIRFSSPEEPSDSFQLSSFTTSWAWDWSDLTPESSFDPFQIGASIFASNIGATHFLGLAGSAAVNGVGVSLFEISSGFALMLLGWVFLPIYFK